MFLAVKKKYCPDRASDIKFMSMIGKQQRQVIHEPVSVLRAGIGRRYKVQSSRRLVLTAERTVYSLDSLVRDCHPVYLSGSHRRKLALPPSL